METIRIHTNSISNVLYGLRSGSITRAIIMDHLDWLSPSSPQDISNVQEEVTELHRALAKDGIVLWRSAAKFPWYNDM